MIGFRQGILLCHKITQSFIINELKFNPNFSNTFSYAVISVKAHCWEKDKQFIFWSIHIFFDKFFIYIFRKSYYCVELFNLRKTWMRAKNLNIWNVVIFNVFLQNKIFISYNCKFSEWNNLLSQYYYCQDILSMFV